MIHKPLDAETTEEASTKNFVTISILAHTLKALPITDESGNFTLIPFFESIQKTLKSLDVYRASHEKYDQIIKDQQINILTLVKSFLISDFYRDERTDERIMKVKGL